MGWLEGWLHRKSHVINSASGAGTNYQIKIKVYYGNGTDSGENVYLNGKCREDFGDIRFTDDDGTTQLDYWMEKKVDGDYAIFWVEVKDDLSSNNVTIYIYYGKSDATTTSNFKNTFLDEPYEFDVDESGEWSGDAWTWDMANSRISTTSGKNFYYISAHNYGRNRKYIARIGRFSSGSDQYFGIIFAYQNSSNYYWVFFDVFSNYIRLRKVVNNTHSTVKSASFTTSNGTYYNLEVHWYSNGRVKVYVNGSLKIDYSSLTDWSSGKFGLRAIGNDTNVRCDRVFVAKALLSPPSHGSWGSEETALAVETLYAIDITSSSAKLVGEILGTGNQSVTKRGFEWGVESGNYTDEWIEEGDFSVETFNKIITDLNPNTTYYFRAKIYGVNDGWKYGAEKTFVTTSWLGEWKYRKGHIIEKASGAGTGYQVKIKVHYGSGTDSGEDVYLNEHCRTDFGDVRFTEKDGETELKYWIEEKVDGDYAVFWVKITDDLSNGDATIYIYYGKPDASTTSNGEDTFSFFDHFEGTELDTDKWGAYTYKSSYSVSNSKLNIKVNESGSGRRVVVYSKNKISTPLALMMKVEVVNPVGYGFFGMATNLPSDYMSVTNQTISLRWDTSSSKLRCTSGDGSSFKIYDYSASKQAGTYRTVTKRTGSLDKLVLETEEKNGEKPTDVDRQIELCVYYTDGAEANIDWVAVRKYTDPEPQHGVWGEEQIGYLIISISEENVNPSSGRSGDTITYTAIIQDEQGNAILNSFEAKLWLDDQIIKNITFSSENYDQSLKKLTETFLVPNLTEDTYLVKLKWSKQTISQTTYKAGESNGINFKILSSLPLLGLLPMKKKKVVPLRIAKIKEFRLPIEMTAIYRRAYLQETKLNLIPERRARKSLSVAYSFILRQKIRFEETIPLSIKQKGFRIEETIRSPSPTILIIKSRAKKRKKKLKKIKKILDLDFD